MDVVQSLEELFHDLLDNVHLDVLSCLLLGLYVLVEIDRYEFENHVDLLNALIFHLH